MNRLLFWVGERQEMCFATLFSNFTSAWSFVCMLHARLSLGGQHPAGRAGPQQSAWPVLLTRQFLFLDAAWFVVVKVCFFSFFNFVFHFLKFPMFSQIVCTSATQRMPPNDAAHPDGRGNNKQPRRGFLCLAYEASIRVRVCLILL